MLSLYTFTLGTVDYSG